jgi:hypothetical protein
MASKKSLPRIGGNASLRKSFTARVAVWLRHETRKTGKPNRVWRLRTAAISLLALSGTITQTINPLCDSSSQTRWSAWRSVSAVWLVTDRHCQNGKPREVDTQTPSDVLPPDIAASTNRPQNLPCSVVGVNSSRN